MSRCPGLVELRPEQTHKAAPGRPKLFVLTPVRLKSSEVCPTEKSVVVPLEVFENLPNMSPKVALGRRVSLDRRRLVDAIKVHFVHLQFLCDTFVESTTFDNPRALTQM